MNYKEDLREFINLNLENESEVEIKDDDNIFEKRYVNSMFAVKLVNYIEYEYAIEVSMDELDISNFSSIDNIVNFIKIKKGE